MISYTKPKVCEIMESYSHIWIKKNYQSSTPQSKSIKLKNANVLVRHLQHVSKELSRQKQKR